MKVSKAEAVVSATRDVKTERPLTNHLSPSQQAPELNGLWGADPLPATMGVGSHTTCNFEFELFPRLFCPISSFLSARQYSAFLYLVRQISINSCWNFWHQIFLYPLLIPHYE